MDLEIRRMSPTDIEPCAGIFIAAFSAPPWNDRCAPEDVQAYLARFLALDGSLCFVCLAGGRLAALSAGMKKPWLGGVEYYIDQFCVAPAFQRRGVGSAFLRLLAAACADEGVYGMMLNTERSFPARRFYERNGFRVEGSLAVLVRDASESK